MTPEEKFISQLTDPVHADICAHLWTLRRYASASRSIVEIGVHDGTTTLAFLLGKPDILNSYDIERQPEVGVVEGWAADLGVLFQFQIGDSREITIPECDLLYIDTDHVARTLYTELTRHAPKARKYVIMHDSAVHGERGRLLPHEAPAGPERDFGGIGLWNGAIAPFLRDDDHWRLLSHTQECNGLTCLLRVADE